jgi:hypothetical protein
MKRLKTDILVPTTLLTSCPSLLCSSGTNSHSAHSKHPQPDEAPSTDNTPTTQKGMKLEDDVLLIPNKPPVPVGVLNSKNPEKP